MQLTFHRADWQFTTPFRISYRSRTHAETVVAEIRDGEFVGRGEASGVSYRGESAGSMLDELSSFAAHFRNGVTRADLQNMLPAGGTRNALDCALWDLEAKRSGRRAWQIAGIDIAPTNTTFTIGLGSPSGMAAVAANAASYPRLKLKLSGDGYDLDRVTEVRRARPSAHLYVDANQAWTLSQLLELTPAFERLGVLLIEQPLPAGQDEALSDLSSSIPLCADESCQTIDSITAIAAKYQAINIKLDKTGGLTHALATLREARGQELKVMVGCMGGSSLAMAPAFVVAQLADLADLDGPLLLSSDIEHGIFYDGSLMHPPCDALWG